MPAALVMTPVIIYACCQARSGAATGAHAVPSSSDHRRMARKYRFTLTVPVAEGHEAYDDPEWVADATWGALSNDYGLECVSGDVELVEAEPSNES